MAFENYMRQQRRGGFSPPAFAIEAMGRGKPARRGKPAPTLLLRLFFKRRRHGLHAPFSLFYRGACDVNVAAELLLGVVG